MSTPVGDSFPVPTYLLFKGNKRLGRNDVIVKVARYAGKDAKKSPQKVRISLDAMRPRQILLRSNWERVCTGRNECERGQLYSPYIYLYQIKRYENKYMIRSFVRNAVIKYIIFTLLSHNPG